MPLYTVSNANSIDVLYNERKSIFFSVFVPADRYSNSIFQANAFTLTHAAQ